MHEALDRTKLTPIDDVLEIARTPGPPPDEFKGWLVGDDPWLDLRGLTIRKRLNALGKLPGALRGCLFQRVVFCDRDREKEPADLSYARLAGSRFDNVVFINTPLTGVYFRGCEFECCDFRYTRVTGTSFQDASFTSCDFYRAFFEAAAVFTEASFTRVSFDKAWVSGITGLTSAMFRARKPVDPTSLPMVQECNEDAYADFLELTEGQRPPSHTVQVALRDAMLDLAEVYRGLSGMWTTQGQLQHAGVAYVQSKALELDYYSPLRRWHTNRMRKKRDAERAQQEGRTLAEDERTPRVSIGPASHVGRWFYRFVPWALANFGESMRRVVGWLLFVILAPGIGFWLAGAVRTDSNRTVHSLPRCLLFSFEQLTDSVHHLQSAGSVVDLTGSLQFVVGVALLGLFGFTLGNKLRNA